MLVFLASQKPSKREHFVPTRMDLGVKLLSGMFKSLGPPHTPTPSHMHHQWVGTRKCKKKKAHADVGKADTCD